MFGSCFRTLAVIHVFLFVFLSGEKAQRLQLTGKMCFGGVSKGAS